MVRSKPLSKKAAAARQATIGAIVNQADAVARLYKCDFAASSLQQTDSEAIIGSLRLRAEMKLEGMLEAAVAQGDLSIFDDLPQVSQAMLDSYACSILKQAVEKHCIHRTVEEDGVEKAITNYYFPVVLPATDGEWRLSRPTGELLEHAWMDLAAVPTERVVVNARLLPLAEFLSLTYPGMIDSLRTDRFGDQAWAEAIPDFSGMPKESIDTSMYVIEFQVITGLEAMQAHFAEIAEGLKGGQGEQGDEDEDDEEEEEEDDDTAQGADATRPAFFAEMNKFISGALVREYGVPVLTAESGNVFEAMAGATVLNEILAANVDITRQLTEKGLLDQEVVFHATLHGHAVGDPTQGSIDQVRISLTDDNNSIAATHIIDVSELPDATVAAALIQEMAKRFKGQPTLDHRIYHICEDMHAPQFFTGKEWVVPSALLMGQTPPRTLH